MYKRWLGCLKFHKIVGWLSYKIISWRHGRQDFSENFWRIQVLFVGPLTPCLDFWWCLLWVSKPEWSPCLHAFSPMDILGFTSGATHADCLVVSMATKSCIHKHWWDTNPHLSMLQHSALNDSVSMAWLHGRQLPWWSSDMLVTQIARDWDFNS